MQSALYSRTCTLEPISCDSEVDFALKLLRVTYDQVPGKESTSIATN